MGKASTALRITDGQKREIERLFRDGARWALEIVKNDLSREEVQRIIDNGDLIREGFPDLLRKTAKGRFSNEEKESDYVYPSGYSPKDITVQTEIIQESFPELAPPKQTEIFLPKQAEALFAIPQWQAVASTYGKAVKKVFKAIASKRPFYNCREGELGPDYLKRSERTERMFQILARQQGNQDILLVPGQFGLRHRGRSVRRAREMFTAQEFGLGAFEVGIMILTHPEHLTDFNDLWVDCPGDEYSPAADGRFGRAPYFGFFDGGVKFVTNWADDAGGVYGSVSAFLSQ